MGGVHMRRSQEPLLFLVAVLGSLIVMTGLSVKWQIAGIVATFITLFLIIFFRGWDYLFSEKGHPKPLKAWFTEEGFSDPYAKIENPKIPMGKSELWYIVGPRITTEFEVINIRFVDSDRKASVLDVEFHQPIGFPKINKKREDGKGGIGVVLRQPYQRIPPDEYLRMKLIVEGHKAGEDYISFRAPIGKRKTARIAYSPRLKVTIEKPSPGTEGPQSQ